MDDVDHLGIDVVGRHHRVDPAPYPDEGDGAVQAGGQSGQPVFFEVCQGSNEQAVDECENQSQGPDSNSQAS